MVETFDESRVHKIKSLKKFKLGGLILFISGLMLFLATLGYIVWCDYHGVILTPIMIMNIFIAFGGFFSNVDWAVQLSDVQASFKYGAYIEKVKAE